MNILIAKLLWLLPNTRLFLHKNFGLNFFFIKSTNFFLKLSLQNLYQSSFLLIFKRFIFILYFVKKKILFSLLTLNKSYLRWVLLVLKGKLATFKVKLQLFGLGKRVLEIKNKYLLVTLGYCHNIIIYKFGPMRFYQLLKRKNALVIKGLSLNDLNNSVFLIRRLRFPDCYNANGIRFVKEIVPLKRRKQWGVF